MAEEKKRHWESGEEKMHYISILVASGKNPEQLKEDLDLWAQSQFPSHEVIGIATVNEIVKNATAAQRKLETACEVMGLHTTTVMGMSSRLGKMIEAVERLTTIVSKTLIVNTNASPLKGHPYQDKVEPGKKPNGTQVDSDGKE